jgi:hypothetical protein
MSPSSITLFASSGFVNSTIMVEADFVSAALDSHPMYLISAFDIKGLLSCRSSALISSNFSMSIELVLIPCARIPYISSRILVPLPIRFIQSFTNCFKASASFLFNVLMLRSPLFSWLADATRIHSMCLFLLCSIVRSTWFYKFLGFLARRLSIVDRSAIFIIISR